MTACQHPTLYDATYHGVFSKFDSLEDKLAKLIEIEQYKHAGEIYLLNRDELEGSRIVVTLRSKIEDKYNESIERLDSAPALIGISYGRVQDAVNIALRISEDYDGVVSGLGNDDLVKQHRERLNSLRSSHEELAEKELKDYLLKGGALKYASETHAHSTLRGVMYKLCHALKVSNGVDPFYRCLSHGISVERTGNVLVTGERDLLDALVEAFSTADRFGINLSALDDQSRDAILSLHGVDKDMVTLHYSPPDQAKYPKSLNSLVVFIEKKTVSEKSSSGTKTSAYLAGERSLPNPNYRNAEYAYNEAVRKQQNCLNYYYSQAANNPYAINLCGFMSGTISEAESRLYSTPQYISEDIYEDYQFIVNESEISIDYRVIVVALNKSGRHQAVVIPYQQVEKFSFAEGLHPKDRLWRLSEFSTDEEVEAFLEKQIAIPPKLLFAKLATEKKVSPQTIKPINMRKKLSGHISQVGEAKDDQILTNSVVIIKTRTGFGSGFFVSPNHILTNAHVVEGQALVTISNRAKKQHSGLVIAKNDELDLALVVVTELSGKPLSLSSNDPIVGGEIRAYGHPKGYDFSVSRGIVSAVRDVPVTKSRIGKTLRHVQSDVAISPGNSGGPIIQSNQVVGVVAWKNIAENSEGLSFCVSSKEVLHWLSSSGVEGLKLL